MVEIDKEKVSETATKKSLRYSRKDFLNDVKKLIIPFTAGVFTGLIPPLAHEAKDKIEPGIILDWLKYKESWTLALNGLAAYCASEEKNNTILKIYLGTISPDESAFIKIGNDSGKPVTSITLNTGFVGIINPLSRDITLCLHRKDKEIIDSIVFKQQPKPEHKMDGLNG